MKPYRGIIKIVCRKKGGCLKNLKENIKPGCIDCPEAKTQILDLEDNVLFEYESPKEKTGKRVAKTKAK